MPPSFPNSVRSSITRKHLVAQKLSCTGPPYLWVPHPDTGWKSPWVGDRVNFARSHNQHLNQTSTLTRAGWDQSPWWPWGYIGWPPLARLVLATLLDSPDTGEGINDSPHPFANLPCNDARLRSVALRNDVCHCPPEACHLGFSSPNRSTKGAKPLNLGGNPV